MIMNDFVYIRVQYRENNASKNSVYVVDNVGLPW